MEMKARNLNGVQCIKKWRSKSERDGKVFLTNIFMKAIWKIGVIWVTQWRIETINLF